LQSTRKASVSPMKKPHRSPVESKIKRVTKISISDEIAKQIMDLISRGELKPGDHLPSERELCKDFGASRSSLREALRCLSIVGVLNARVGEGTSVAEDGEKFLRKIIEWRLITERHDIENLLEVRMALEGVSAANTARHATAEQVEELRKLVAKMRASLKDEKTFAALDLDFHVAMAEASGNELVFDLIALVRGQLLKALHKVLVVPHALPLALKEHAAIFDAIQRRDPDGAREAMQKHLLAHLMRYNAANRNSNQVDAKGNGKRANGVVERDVTKVNVAKASKPRTRKLILPGQAVPAGPSSQIAAK
jgi:GntR family transcriptional regulator, transcriptional repressor for pyruvate dehydrogenase complex